jgi:hypothetical protein
MIKPDDDFDDDFDDDVETADTSDDTVMALKPNQKQHDTRRKIEDILEARRLKEEFGDLAL